MSIKTFFTSNKKRTVLLIGVIVLTAGLIPTLIFTFFADPAHPYTLSEVTLVTEDGINLQATVATPSTPNGAGIVNSHGFCGNKRWSQQIAIELVKRGFVVVSIDARGHGASDGYLERDDLPNDIMAAIGYLQNLGSINKLGLVGHSMGGGNSMRVASMYPTLINATVSIGAPTTLYNYTQIPNLMMTMGKYEQTNPPSELIDFLTAYTGNQSAELGIIYGNFTLGNATKASLSPSVEHLFEPFDVFTIKETIKWFELAFFGSIQGAIMITTPHFLISLAVTSVGCLICLFIGFVYLGNYIAEKKQRMDISFVKNQSVIKPIIYYTLLVPTLGFMFFLLLSDVFSAMIPIDMFGSVFASLVFGKAVFILLVCYLFLSRNQEGKRSFKTITTALKDMTSGNFGRSLIYGVLAGVLTIISLGAILHWSFNTSIPTAREVGTIISITLIFFPFLLIKELYFRTVQERLKAAKQMDSRLKEYFSIVGIGLLMDLTIPIILMVITWQGSFGVIAFVLFPTSIFTFCRHIIVPWVYMHSRNIVGSALFYSILWAWMIIGFYPFGTGASIGIH